MKYNDHGSSPHAQSQKHENHAAPKPERRQKRNRDESNGQDTPRKAHKTHHSAELQALNDRHPETWPKIPISTYDSSRPLRSSSISVNGSAPVTAQTVLPPLPPITDPKLKDAPFTHASAVDSKYSTSTTLTYERLEFVGDAYIEVIATRIIFSRFPTLLAGKQSQLREQMVRNSTLAGYARGYGFDRLIKSGVQEKGKEKIVADVFEAYVAAVILSDPVNGFVTAEAWLTELWTGILMQHDAQPITMDLKTELSKHIMVKTTKLEYRKVKFDTRSQDCEIEVHLTGWGSDDGCIGRGIGRGKTEAGMVAAKNVLDNGPLMLKLKAKKKQRDDERKSLAADAATE